MTENTTASGAADRPEALKLASILRGLDTRHYFGNKNLVAAADELERLHALAASAPVAPTPEGFVQAPHYRGYANLGTGQYVLNHTAPHEPAELIISIASDEDKAGRTIGDDRGNPAGKAIQPDEMAVRLAFTSVAGLDALEKQLRYLREVHFPQAAPVAPTQPDWRELCRRLYAELFHCDKQMTCTLNEMGDPMWRTGAEVRDVLSDAKAALEANPITPEAAPVAPTPPADRWRERWYGSGGVSGFQGWSIVNDRTNALVAYLCSYVSSEAVSEIVMAHNNALLAAADRAARGAAQAAPQGFVLVSEDAADLLKKYKQLCLEIGRGGSHHFERIDRAIASIKAPQQGEYPETLYEGGRESVDDALAVVESFGPGVQGLNDTFARQVLLGQEVRRLRAAYEHACQGRSDFRNLYRAARGAAQAAPAKHMVIDWPLYNKDPVLEMDDIYADYSKSFGITPGPVMAKIVQRHQARLQSWFGGHREAIRSALVSQAQPAPVAEDAEIRKALHDAATSLETISRIAGKDQYMLEMVDVRIYAAARAKVARDAQAAQPEGGAA